MRGWGLRLGLGERLGQGLRLGLERELRPSSDAQRLQCEYVSKITQRICTRNPLLCLVSCQE